MVRERAKRFNIYSRLYRVVEEAPGLHFSIEQNKMDHLLLKSLVLKLNLKKVEEKIVITLQNT